MSLELSLTKKKGREKETFPPITPYREKGKPRRNAAVQYARAYARKITPERTGKPPFEMIVSAGKRDAIEHEYSIAAKKAPPSRKAQDDLLPDPHIFAEEGGAI